MRRLRRALALYFDSGFTWRRCWELAKPTPRYRIVAHDNFLYIEPRPGYQPSRDLTTPPPQVGSGVSR
jgi:hypothetical protein